MSQAIAAAASLALAVKLQKIFEKENKYLTFPTGLGFSYRYLEFMKDPSTTSLSAQEQLNFKADFSRQMNFIPEDKSTFVPDGSRFLWDEVERILVDSVFAESALTPEEENQLAEAIDFLTDDQVDADGNKVPVNSPQVAKYYEYKTLYEEAERTYLDEKLSVQFAEGPDAHQLQEKWNAYREKQLRELSDKAEQDWINLGFKRQVEEYQAQKNSLELRKYLSLYRQDYLNELAISEIPDLNGHGTGFCTTFFSPADAFDKQLPWTSITLTKSEMIGLIREAPPALKDRYGVDQGILDIEAFSLEYNNVIVIRPWFKPEFFGSRYWKLPDARVISNGQVPRGGILPAFVTSMIVARNIRITSRKEVAKQTVVLPLVSKVPIQALKLSATSVGRPQRIARPPVATVAGRPAVFVAKPVAAATGAPPPRSSFPRIRVSSVGIRPAGTGTKAGVPLALKTQVFYATAKYQGMTIKAPAGRPVMRPRPEGDLRLPPKSNQLVTETIDLYGVSVLALVCKRLPKSPDPDVTLQW